MSIFLLNNKNREIKMLPHKQLYLNFGHIVCIFENKKIVLNMEKVNNLSEDLTIRVKFLFII